MSTANSATVQVNLNTANTAALTAMVRQSIATANAQHAQAMALANTVTSLSVGAWQTLGAKPAPPKPLELTVLPVDLEHPDLLIIRALNITSEVQFKEMLDWLNAEADGYPRPVKQYQYLRVLTPYAVPRLLALPTFVNFVFDRATQEKLAIYFRMRWS
jgi:hypothetical protein